MRCIAFAAGLLLSVLCLAEEADYIVRGGDLPVAAASNGYLQEIRTRPDGGLDVHVATSLAPIGARATYADIVARGEAVAPLGFELPPRLTAGLRPEMSAWEAATAIMAWTANRVAVDVQDRGPQDAVSVLSRKRGRCSGLANATVALLNAAGYEARTVSGLLVGDRETIAHRWIECRLPGAGWVASDPTLGLWAMTPRHLVFGDTVTSMPQVQIQKAGVDGLDRLPSYEGRFLRPNNGAELVCNIRLNTPDPTAVAVLKGGGSEVRRAQFDPDARFAGLLPGLWVLEVVVGGVVVERREFELRSGDVRVYTVKDLGDQSVRESES